MTAASSARAVAGLPVPCTLATNECPSGRRSVTLSARREVWVPGWPELLRLWEAHPVAAVDGVERRDVELFRYLSPAAFVGVQQVGMALPVRVVHLGHHAGERAVGAVAPVDGQRVEHVAEDPRLREHHHLAAIQADAAGLQEPVEVVPDRVLRVAEMVAGFEGREQSQAWPEPWQVVEVDQPLVAAVGERVPQRRGPQVGDPALVQHRSLGQRAPACHHQVPPSARAAWAPDRQPSSWKPQPW